MLATPIAWDYLGTLGKERDEQTQYLKDVKLHSEDLVQFLPELADDVEMLVMVLEHILKAPQQEGDEKNSIVPAPEPAPAPLASSPMDVKDDARANHTLLECVALHGYYVPLLSKECPFSQPFEHDGKPHWFHIRGALDRIKVGLEAEMNRVRAKEILEMMGALCKVFFSMPDSIQMEWDRLCDEMTWLYYYLTEGKEASSMQSKFWPVSKQMPPEDITLLAVHDKLRRFHDRWAILFPPGTSYLVPGGNDARLRQSARCASSYLQITLDRLALLLRWDKKAEFQRSSGYRLGKLRWRLDKFVKSANELQLEAKTSALATGLQVEHHSSVDAWLMACLNTCETLRLQCVALDKQPQQQSGTCSSNNQFF